MNYNDELVFASTLIRNLGDSYVSRGKMTVSKKSNISQIHDLVTNLDVSTEESIRASIKKRYPDDLFVGEETDSEEKDVGRVWIVDPIDGTVNFVRGLPFFGTQLALTVNGEAVMSVIYLPKLNEMYTATKSDGARLNGVKIEINRNVSLSESIVAMCDFSKKCSSYRKTQYQIIGNMYDKVSRIKMIGASCCDFGMITSGKADIHFRYMNHIWDYLPGLFLCETAGAYIDQNLKNQGFLLVASSEKLGKDFKNEVISDIII